MPKERTRKAHGNVKLEIEKCSSVACRRKPIIEIVSWDGIALDTHKLLCREHWLELCDEPERECMKMKVIHFVKDMRSYL